MRKCWLPAFSPFLTMFSKGLFLCDVKSCNCVVKGYAGSHSSVTAVHCFDVGYLGKQPVALIEYCGDYWFKEAQESRCTSRRYITEIMLKTALKHNTVNQYNDTWVLELNGLDILLYVKKKNVLVWLRVKHKVKLFMSGK